jgi:SAM-dependent methyltransferase
MGLVENFEKEYFFERLQKRRFTFAKIFEYLSTCAPGLIVETGTLRIIDNFEGDGQSTFLWDWFLRQTEGAGFEAHSVDISESACEVAKKHCPSVKIFESDSLKHLSAYAQNEIEKIRLLYLDSFDWHQDINLDSAFHHMAELACVYSRLTPGTLIVVDDRHSNLMGKHFMVNFFFEKLGVSPVFCHYQIGWVKP